MQPKDESSTHPIASALRPIFCDVVKAFADDDFELLSCIENVDPVSLDIAAQNRDYVRSYGETLTELPEQTWNTSCAQWMGDYWDVLVDLFTIGEGASDLVLTGKLYERDGNYRFSVGLIYVP